MATALFSEEDEEEEGDRARRRLLGLDKDEEDGGEKDHRKREMSFLEIWDGHSPDPLWTVEIGDGFVVEVHDSESSAIRSAKQMSREDEGSEEIQVVKHVKIPIGIWEDLQLVGKRDSPFSDGYEIGSIISSYTSKETKDGIVFSWNLHDDVEFKNWPSGKKKEEIERVFGENYVSSDLPLGMKLYLLVEDEEPWLDEIEQQRKEEETGENAETYLDDPIFASSSPASAHVFPGTAYEGKFLVTIQLEEPISKDRVIFVPWADLGGSSREEREIDELSRVLESCVDPKDSDFDPESISDRFNDIRREDRKHWGPIGLQIQTDDQGSFLLFFWPYPPQEDRFLINKSQVRVKVLSVEQI